MQVEIRLLAIGVTLQFSQQNQSELFNSAHRSGDCDGRLTDLQTGIGNWCQTQCEKKTCAPGFLADFPEYQRSKYGEAGVSCVADL